MLYDTQCLATFPVLNANPVHLDFCIIQIKAAIIILIRLMQDYKVATDSCFTPKISLKKAQDS